MEDLLNAFKNGFLSIFGHNVFEEQVREIKNRTVESALKSDMDAISADFNKVFKRESALLDEDLKPE